MTDVQRTLRQTRLLEGFFAAVALYLSLALPIPPADARETYLLVHGYATGAVAVWLLFALRKPSRGTSAVAVALSAYVVLNFLSGLAHFGYAAEDPALGYAGSAIVWSYMIVGSAALAQLIVAIQCWRTRSIWTIRPPSSSSAPVA